MEKQGLGEILSCHAAAPYGLFLPFSACTHPAPTKGMHTSIVFCCPQPVTSHDFLQRKSIWDSLPYSTGKNSPVSSHQQAPNTNYVCYLSVCSGSRPWAALLLLELSPCQAVGLWQCRQEMHLRSLLMTELYCGLFSHTYTAPFAPLLSGHSCRRQRLDPECLVHSSDISLVLSKATDKFSTYQLKCYIYNISLKTSTVTNYVKLGKAEKIKCY